MPVEQVQKHLRRTAQARAKFRCCIVKVTGRGVPDSDKWPFAPRNVGTTCLTDHLEVPKSLDDCGTFIFWTFFNWLLVASQTLEFLTVLDPPARGLKTVVHSNPLLDLLVRCDFPCHTRAYGNRV